jgi:hypothetical protein
MLNCISIQIYTAVQKMEKSYTHECLITGISSAETCSCSAAFLVLYKIGNQLQYIIAFRHRVSVHLRVSYDGLSLTERNL